MSNISRIIQGFEVSRDQEYEHTRKPADMAAYRFAPITTCDMLTDRRHNLMFENLWKMFILKCNLKNVPVEDSDSD